MPDLHDELDHLADRIDQRLLNDGDELTFGNTRMRFEAS